MKGLVSRHLLLTNVMLMQAAPNDHRSNSGEFASPKPATSCHVLNPTECRRLARKEMDQLLVFVPA
jgi:hypothetical protein